MKLFQYLRRLRGKRMPVLLQGQAAESGPACLAMIAGYYGKRVDLPQLQRRFATAADEISLARLIQFAATLELACRPVRIETARLHALRTPALLHCSANHYVLLKRVDGDQLLIHDPALGERTVTLEHAVKSFSGIAMEVEPTLQFRQQQKRRLTPLRGLLGRIRGLQASLVQVLLLALVLELLTLGAPRLAQWIVDDVLVSHDQELLNVIIGGIFLLGVLHAALSLVRSWILVHMSASLNLQWSANVLGHLLRLPMGFFEQREAGDVAARFASIGSIRRAMGTGFVSAIVDGLMVVPTLAMMLVYAPRLATLSLATMAMFAGLRQLRFASLLRASERQIGSQARQDNFFFETLRGMQALKLFNRQDERKTAYLKCAVDTVNADIEVQHLTLSMQAANAVLLAAAGSLILWLGCQAVLTGSMTAGMLVAFLLYKGQFTLRACGLIENLFALRLLRLQAERLADIVLTTPEPDRAGAPVDTAHLAPRIELRNVAFRYADDAPWIFKGLNFSVAAGESVVLAGPSGCGKTTLLKIMLGQLQPQEGEVLIGGIPLMQLGLHRYRSLIGVVMQDDGLFAGSLADNIALFHDLPDQSAIESGARLAQIHHEILQMPLGYNTMVGDMGCAFSGGQRQRILLARALYKRPAFLFLDEATSQLEPALEQSIARGLRDLHRTCIVIAHRQETAQASGRVVLVPGLVASGREDRTAA